jgi:hypothetical protein
MPSQPIKALPKPTAGEEVSKLWRYVSAAIDSINTLRKGLAELDARIPTRRRMDSTAPEVGVVAQMFAITALSGDYLTCREWDGETLGDEDIYVAKPIRCRTSNTTETVDGIALTYTYDDEDPSNVRLASDGTNTQWEVCYPRYVIRNDDEIYSVIWATRSANGTGVEIEGVPVEWVELSARIWLRRYAQ